jgi:SAM-dependent methyltransferase
MNPLILRCVECGAEGLESQPAFLHCTKCDTRFPLHLYKSIPVLISRRSRLNTDEILKAKVNEAPLKADAAERHWNTGQMSKLVTNCPRGRLLSYGSGEGGDRYRLESIGYTVTAFDIYPTPSTDVVCDGHDLPFAGNQFEVVTSMAVFEHLYDPFVAAAEKYRVLKPGGVLVGSLAFLEPFHASSYFHMSHYGLTEVLTRAGFHNIEIQPGWSWLESLNSNFWLWNKFRAIRALTRRCNRLRYRCGLSLWKMGYRLKGKPIPKELTLMYAGSLQFRAEK